MKRTVTGVNSVSKRLKAIPKEVRAAAQKSALSNAEKMAGDMRRLAPVSQDGSHGNPPGALRDSIAVTPGGQQVPSYAGVGAGGRVPDDAVAVSAGNSKARYAHLVEFGTSKMNPQPFFVHVVRMTKRKAMRSIKSAISRAIKKAK